MDVMARKTESIRTITEQIQVLLQSQSVDDSNVRKRLLEASRRLYQSLQTPVETMRDMMCQVGSKISIRNILGT